MTKITSEISPLVFVLWLFLQAFIPGALAALLAVRRKRSIVRFTLVGLVFSWVGLLILLIALPSHRGVPRNAHEDVQGTPVTQAPRTGHAPSQPQGWLRRRWWRVLLVAAVIIAIGVSAGFHAKRVGEQQTALRVAQTVPGALGPFEWGETFTMLGAARITVSAPVADGETTSGNSHSVHCDITVENISEKVLTVPAHNFLMWDTVQDGPLRPVEATLETHVNPGESATFTIDFNTTGPTISGCVTCGGPDVSSGNGIVWQTNFIQWGELPALPST